VDWIHLGQDRVLVVGSSENGNEPPDSIKVREFLDWLSDSFSYKDSAPWN
jgi:hypothetical protein